MLQHNLKDTATFQKQQHNSEGFFTQNQDGRCKFNYLTHPCLGKDSYVIWLTHTAEEGWFYSQREEEENSDQQLL